MCQVFFFLYHFPPVRIILILLNEVKWRKCVYNNLLNGGQSVKFDRVLTNTCVCDVHLHLGVTCNSLESSLHNVNVLGT